MTGRWAREVRAWERITLMNSDVCQVEERSQKGERKREEALGVSFPDSLFGHERLCDSADGLT